MQAVELDIMGETAGDDITVTWDLTLDGVAFPSTSVFTFIAELVNDPAIEISASASISATEITATISKTKTQVSGIYKYKLKEVTVGSLQRTPARGRFELKDVPVEG